MIAPRSQKLTGLCIRKRFVFVPREVAGMERDPVSPESLLRCKAALCNRVRPSHNVESRFRNRCSDSSCCIQTDDEAVAKHSLAVGPPSNSERGPLDIGSAMNRDKSSVKAGGVNFTPATGVRTRLQNNQSRCSSCLPCHRGVSRPYMVRRYLTQWKSATGILPAKLSLELQHEARPSACGHR